MKTPLIALFACSVLMISCGENQNLNQESTVGYEVGTAVHEGVAEVVDTCCGAKYHIYGETAYLWQKTWQNRYPNEDTALTRFFTEASIDELKKEIEKIFPEDDLTGYRMYYGLLNATDSVPILVMTRTSYCDDLLQSETECVLLSTTNEDTINVLITPETASTYTENWRNLVANVPIAHCKVKAYNYSTDEIRSVLNDSANTDNEINIRFGMRSTSPAEIDYNHSSDTTGCIIYCNVLYGTDINPALSESFDFARPCPRLCGTANILQDTEYKR